MKLKNPANTPHASLRAERHPGKAKRHDTLILGGTVSNMRVLCQLHSALEPKRPNFRTMPSDIILVSSGFVLKLAKVGREISVTEVEDLSILREAQKELGIKER